MKIDGLCREAEPLAPRLDQQRDQLPLRAARVLELVDQHVVVARLEPEAALRELVHLAQQVERALEHVREVEDRPLVERGRYCASAIANIRRMPRASTTFRSRVNCRHDPLDLRRRSEDARRDGAARRLRSDSRAPCRDGSRPLRRGCPSLRQEVRAQCGRAAPRTSRVAERVEIAQPSDLAHEQLIARVRGPARRPGTAVQAAAVHVHAARRAAVGRAPADDARRQVRRAARQEPIERVPGDEPPIEQRREPLARARDAELREHERDVRIRSGQAGEDAQRPIERLLDEPRHLGLVRHVEAGIEVRLERELAQQRQAERVDRADRDLAEPIAQLASSAPGRTPSAPPRPAARATIRSRISAAAFRVNVIARMFAGSTPAFSRFT